MKKLFVAILLILAIIAIGLFVFALTFDANKYKPLLIEKIARAIEKDVRIDNISLSILPRISITVNGISIKDVNKTWENVLLEAGSVDARLRLLPLIRRDIQIEHLLIRDMDVFFENNIKIGITEAVLRNVSLYGPIDIAARLSLFGRGRENIRLKTLLYPELESKKPYIKNLDLKIDLGSFNLQNALDTLGQDELAQQLIGKDIAGELKINAKKMYLGPEKIYGVEAYVVLSNGATTVLPIRDGLEDIEVRAEVSNGDVIIQKLTGLIGEAPFSATGVIVNALSSQRYIKNFNLRLDLRKFDIKSVLSSLGKGGAAQQFIGNDIMGELDVSSKKMYLDAKNIYSSDLYVEISNGAIDLLYIKGGIRNIELEAEMSNGNAVIQNLAGLLGGGTFLAKGAVKDIRGAQSLSFDITLKDINLANLLPDPVSGKPHFEGILGIDMNGSARGLKTPAILDTLITSGTLELDRAVLKDINILTSALERLDMLPSLVQKLKRRLPERYKELLREKDTSFRPVETMFSMRGKRLSFQRTVVESDAFYLVGSGYLDTNGTLSVSSDLFIPQDLSNAFISVVRELEYLQNAEGMITMPIYIDGRFPNISVKPDLDYVIQKLAVSKGQELLESIFRKERPEESRSEPELEPQPDEESQVQKEPKRIEPEEAIIRTIFDIITGPRE